MPHLVVGINDASRAMCQPTQIKGWVATWPDVAWADELPSNDLYIPVAGAPSLADRYAMTVLLRILLQALDNSSL